MVVDELTNDCTLEPRAPTLAACHTNYGNTLTDVID
jgi:hypothetical protein